MKINFEANADVAIEGSIEECLSCPMKSSCKSVGNLSVCEIVSCEQGKLAFEISETALVERVFGRSR